MCYVTRIPVSELHDTMFALDSFFSKSEFDELTSQLREPASAQQKFETLESFLLDESTYRVLIQDCLMPLPRSNDSSATVLTS